MKYITHHRFKGKTACGEMLNIPYGTELDTVGDFIVTLDGKPICYATSENAKRHFARNDDQCGLERGKLTFAIAYASRKKSKGFRFSESEAKMLEQEWSHFLHKDVDTILFNENFFNAKPEELQRLANALNIKVRRT